MSRKRGSSSNSNDHSVKTKKKTKLGGSTEEDKLLELKLAECREFDRRSSNWKLSDALSHLAAVDSSLKKVILEHDIPDRLKPGGGSRFSPYTSLVKSIVYQQIAGAAAESIYKKFCAAVGVSADGDIPCEVVYKAKSRIDFVDGKKKVLINESPSGLSEPKFKYIQSLTEHFMDSAKLKNVNFQSISEEELFSKLIQVKGLGSWSIHMFMMFHLQRPNVLPTGDLGVRRGVCALYNLPPKTFEGGRRGEAEMRERCKHWEPYSSVASMYMWQVVATVVMK